MCCCKIPVLGRECNHSLSGQETTFREFIRGEWVAVTIIAAKTEATVGRSPAGSLSCKIAEEEEIVMRMKTWISTLLLLAIAIGPSPARAQHPETCRTDDYFRRALDPFWRTNEMHESCFFIQPAPATGRGSDRNHDADDKASWPQSKLLFLPNEVVEVKSLSHLITYQKGRDYVVDEQTGVIYLPLASRIPFKTMDQLFPTVWQTLLQRKTFYDITGNGVNHPNDFSHMLYAQTILGLLIPGPVAYVGMGMPDEVAVTNNYQLDATRSLPGPNGPITYHWQMAANSHPATINGADTATPTIKFSAGPGTYLLTLTVTDAHGAQNTEPIMLTYVQR